jgi:hypothetical protein
MHAPPTLSPAALRRQSQLSSVADWYRQEPWIHELEHSGWDVLVTVDHMDRLIRVESCDRRALHRKPIEERMEFDQDVLSLVHDGLEDPDHALIVDCSDIPGRLDLPGGGSTRGLTARVLVVDFASGEVLTEKTIMKEHPEFPKPLKNRLLAIPAGEGESTVYLRALAAERFVDEQLHACQAGAA